MRGEAVISVERLGAPWQTSDPFLFCMHHDDAYPAGNEHMGPDASLEGRHIGQDFQGKDGWRMYHGDVVPGFPRHPHRGFETITLVRKGFIDHSDSLGATARFGHGDAQWMTAGRGIVHSEMFPLVDRSGPNPVELFQIWLNLPAKDKLVDPHFTMLWHESIPRHTHVDGQGRRTDIAMVAGKLADASSPPPPPPSSWASRPDAQVAIWTVRMQPGATWEIPPTGAGISRTAYFFRGSSLHVDGRAIPPYSGVRLVPAGQVSLRAGDDETELLVLQGRPLGQPVAQYGPFVMNTSAEIQQAFVDYRRTEFGGWPWRSDGPVHERDQGRFAIHADGRRDEPVG